MSTIIQDAERLAKVHMDSYKDVSHDWLHVERVRKLAMVIARSLQPEHTIDLLVVELAALFHDLHDSKYSASSDIYTDLYSRFFSKQIADGSITADQAKLVAKICDNVSYSKEVKRIQGNTQTERHSSCLELHCVQDADKLDAMGAIGILRCAAYSAAKNRPLLENGSSDDAVGHFHDKLLKLNGMLKTPKGREFGERRDQALVTFIEQCSAESRQLDGSSN